MVFCSKCGAENEDTARFCKKCVLTCFNLVKEEAVIKPQPLTLKQIDVAWVVVGVVIILAVYWIMWWVVPLGGLLGFIAGGIIIKNVKSSNYC